MRAVFDFMTSQTSSFLIAGASAQPSAAMQLPALFAALTLPLAFCFDTKLLDGVALGDFPLEIKSLAGELGTLLREYDWLHFDEEQKEWRDTEISLFNNEYFPLLQQFVTVAIQLAQLSYQTQDSENVPCLPQLQFLRKALDCVLNTGRGRYEASKFDERYNHLAFNVIGGSGGSVNALMMAKADFMALRSLYMTFDSCHRGLYWDGRMDLRWAIEAATFGPVVGIGRSIEFIRQLFVFCKRLLTHDELAYISVLTLRLNGSIHELPRLFCELETAVEELVAAKWDS